MVTAIRWLTESLALCWAHPHLSLLEPPCSLLHLLCSPTGGVPFPTELGQRGIARTGEAWREGLLLLDQGSTLC